MTWVPPDRLPHTMDDWLATPEADGYHYELFQGRIVRTPVEGDEHQRIQLKMMVGLLDWEKQHRLGLGYGPVNLMLPPDVALVPDGLVALRKHLDCRTYMGITGSPDLVVEILSPTTRERDLTTKRAIYERHGVPEYWIVDPEARAVTCLALEQDGYRVAAVAAERLVSTHIPELTLDVTALFHER